MSKSKISVIFVSIFFSALVIQVLEWYSMPLKDEMIWIGATKDIVHNGIHERHDPNTNTAYSDLQMSGNDDFRDSIYDDPVYVYPATTIFFPAALVVKMGISTVWTLRATISILLSLCIAAIISLCAYMRPKNPWWIAVIPVLLLSPYYTGSTLASSLTVLLIPMMMLLAIHIIEQEKKAGLTNGLLIVFGVIGGFSLATRFDVNMLVFGTIIATLFLSIRGRVTIPSLVAGTLFFVLNPFMWRDPIGYFDAIYNTARVLQDGYHAGLSLLDLLSFSPLVVVSIVLLTFSLFRPKALAVPMSMAWWLLIVTGGYCTFLYSGNYHQNWYMYPFFMAFEIILPLTVLKLIDQSPETGRLFLDKKQLSKFSIVSIYLVYIFFAVSACLPVIASAFMH